MTTPLKNFGWQVTTASAGNTLTTLQNTKVDALSNTRVDEFASPHGIAFNPDGSRLAVADVSNHRILIFGVTGNTITLQTSFGSREYIAQPGAFTSPRGVVFSPDGSRLAVADTDNNRVQIFGIVNNTISHQVSSVDGQFVFPASVAFSPDGSRLAVADTGNNRIQVFGIVNNTMTHQVSYGSLGAAAGQFNNPYSVAFSPNGSRLVIADLGNNRIQVFDIVNNTITHQVSYGSAGGGVGQFSSPIAVTFSPDGSRLAVMDTYNHRIQVLGIVNNTITHQVSYGSTGSAAGRFNYPRGIAFSPDGSRLAVADTNNHRIQVLGVVGNTVSSQVTYGSLGYAPTYGAYCAAFNPGGTLLALTDTLNGRISVLGVSYDTMTHLVSYGSSGTGNGQFSSPYAIAFSPDGSRLVVADTNNHRLHVLGIVNSTVTHQAIYGSSGTTCESLSNPRSVAFSPDGVLLAVINSGNNNLQVLKAVGSTMTHLMSSGKIYYGEWGVAINPASLRMLITCPPYSKIHMI